MQGQKFFRTMPFTLETGIEALLDFSLPRRVVHAETLPDVFRQFQAVIGGQLVHGAF